MAIENANTIEERGSKIGRNSVFDCHLTNGNRKNRYKQCFRLPFVATTGDKWQSKTLFLSILLATNGNRKHCLLSIFDPRSSIVDSVFDCRLPGVVMFFPIIYYKVSNHARFLIKCRGCGFRGVLWTEIVQSTFFTKVEQG